MCIRDSPDAIRARSLRQVNPSNVQRVPETAASPSVPAEPVHGASLARNALHLVTGQVLTMVLGVVFSAALGRTLGAGDFGLYFVCLLYTSDAADERSSV